MRRPSRSIRFDTPMNPATKAVCGRSYTSIGSPTCSMLAVVEHGDAVAHRERFFLVVRDVDKGDADLALDPQQLELHLLAELEVERAERLVEQQHLRLVHDRAGQGDALALAAGQLRRLARAEPGQPDHLQGPGGPARGAPPSAPAAPAARTRRSRSRSCAGTARSPGTRC